MTEEKPRYYLVTGRILGDDEDHARVVYQPSEEAARELFIEMAIEAAAEWLEDDSPVYLPEDVVITTVAVSDSPIEILYQVSA